ncbi:biotin synthase BioB [Desulfobulbus oligotrophicus]|uniref:Biotin synthase n=1 Tax=Desulfobulbus oligotrophicus TaxID=1909699 RepID=A0A7T5VCW3_9BACT|nr:biotin synthase BioB [Desulfobulbus oligotrophicus]QQG65439.1 biotin synthase BioB [Desulfobulbus oligotrophicus]
MDITVQQISDAVLAGTAIDRPAALSLLTADQQDLWQAADALRRHFMGDHFDLCSIINAKSGNCTENCRFCAQSARHHTGITTYQVIAEDEAMHQALDNDHFGVHRLSLVTSGHHLSADTLAALTRLYRQMTGATSMLFCASAGFLDQHTADTLYAAGVRRYHCNLEASQNYFPEVCTTHTWEEKVQTLRLAQETGMSLCSGGILGMGETMADRIDMAFELRDLGVKSIPINILTPIAGTPLAELVPLSTEEVLTTVALFRFINPDAVIRMAGGRQQLGDDQYRCFAAGANGAIVGNYLTTTGAGIADDLHRLAAMGFTFERPAL